MAVITLSRQIGAGGWILGKSIATRLGYLYVNEIMIQEVAKRGKISKEKVRIFEKVETARLIKLLDKFVFDDDIERIVSKRYGYIDENRYLEIISTIFRELHERDNVVIVGRGSQYVLKDLPNTYHVLLVGNLEDRIRYMMDEYNLTEVKAKSLMKKREQLREQVLNLFSKKNHEDPLTYDLVINTTRIELKKAEELVITLISD